MDNPRFLLSGECEPLRAGDQVRIYARRGPYFCIYPRDRTSPCKWTLDAGYQSYVVMDASGAFSLAEREAGIARMVQRGVILTDYFAITVEMMRSNADPRSNEVYAALDMDFAVLVGQISKADAAKAQKSSSKRRSVDHGHPRDAATRRKQPARRVIVHVEPDRPRH